MIATYRGVCEHTDPTGVTDAGRAEWEKHLKADHPHPTYRHGDPRVKVFKRPTVTLSKIEKEWLGQYVTIRGWVSVLAAPVSGVIRGMTNHRANASDVWQVWSAADRPGHVWLVRHGNACMAAVADLTARASASEYEDVAFNFEMDDAA